MGGRSKNSNGISTLYKTVSALDLETLEWQEKSSLPFTLAAGSGVAVPAPDRETYDQNALLFGGDRGIIFTQVEALIAKAAALDGAAQDSVIQKKNHLQSTHTGFSREVLSYRPDTDEWEIAGEISAAVPVTTAALYQKGKIYITSGEVRPGVRTPVILEGTIHPQPDSGQ